MAERKAFLLRIDLEVWAELEAWAQAELRSVNGQVEFVLREALQRRRGGRPRRASGSGGKKADGGGGTTTEGTEDTEEKG